MLPGKYCIGILEEDNPLKSYFRLKPLLVEIDGKYQPFEGGENYPENGCIRIVPDKNESSHFKGRMRRMGRYCVLDLREHCGENDKIRPNKNYHGDESERNAHIVYSDVVREPAADMIFEIADFEGETWQGDAPGTPRILKGEELATWRFLPGEEGEAGRVEPDGQFLAEDELQRIEIEGFPGEMLKLAIRLPAYMESVIGVPSPREPIAAIKAAIKKEEPRVQPPPQPAPEAEKPWISHDPQPVVRVEHVPQGIAAQTGLNPRRSRSLQEIIEEKWRHSRVDQLGHPIPVHAMGKPVANPVECAVEALRNAWSNPEIHGELLEALRGLQEITGSFQAHSKSIANAARQRELEDLEAERLRALSDLDKLRRDKTKLRESFKQEIRTEEADAFRDAVERTKLAQAECKKYEALAEEARRGAEMAQDAFAALKDGRFEEKLKDFALTSRAAELLSRPEPELHSIPSLSNEIPDRAEWLRRVHVAFAHEGLEISDVHAMNLLVCAALSEKIIFSGAAASDKLPAARALARAIGGCCELRGGSCDAEDAIVLIPEANAEADGDLFRGFEGSDRCAFAVVSDGGAHLQAEDLEQSFFVRISAPVADTPWKPVARPEEELLPLRLSALRAAFLSNEAELPHALERRLQNVRNALSMHGVRLSRRTLDMMWHYCAVMLDLGKISPGEALDRAFAQKALPCILAEARVDCLAQLKTILADMPRSLALLNQPLPILI